jgi:hypothetical protein
MDDQFNISKPNQGVNTLVSELSLLRLEKTITLVEEMRSKGSSEKDIRDFIDERHKDFDKRSRTQIYRLSLGLIPKDDFTRDDLSGLRRLNETTLEITLRRPNPEFQECSLVFYEGQRWVVVSASEAILTLKRF